VAIGFAIMGFIGYFVKLIHIPMYVFIHQTSD
jgi:preprotein translocase subunit Sss1